MTSARLHGIVLAAGRGSRLGPLTEGKPKCLVELAHRPLIDWQIDALREGGVAEIGIVGGYLAEMLERSGIEKFFNGRWRETNMVGSLLVASPWLERFPCVVSYSDIFYPAQPVRDLSGCGHDIAIAYDANWLDLWRARFTDPLSDAETFARTGDGRLVEIGGKAKSVDEIGGQYMGLLYFTPDGWSKIRSHIDMLPAAEVDRLSMTELLSQLIRTGTKIQTVPLVGRWGEIDSLDDLAVYERSLNTISMERWLTGNSSGVTQR